VIKKNEIGREEKIRMERERQMRNRYISCNAKMHKRYIELLQEHVPAWAQKMALRMVTLYRPFEVAFIVWPGQLRKEILRGDAAVLLKMCAMVIFYLPLHLITTVLALLFVWPTAGIGRLVAAGLKTWGIKSDRRIVRDGVMQLLVYKRVRLFRWQEIENSEWKI